MRAKFNLEKKPIEDTTHKAVESLFTRTKKTHVVLPPVLSQQTVRLMLFTFGSVLLLAIVLVFIPSIWSGLKPTSVTPIATPEKLSKQDVQKVVEKVRTHMVLPDEEPQIVAITNVDSLKKQQAFFSMAQNGDQLLVYPSKVILYRPSSDQVVDVAQIRLSPTPQSASPSAGL
jgi:hypothetical protein